MWSREYEFAVVSNQPSSEPRLLHTHGGPSEAGDCSHPPPKMVAAEKPTSGKGSFDNVMGHRSLRLLACE